MVQVLRAVTPAHLYRSDAEHRIAPPPPSGPRSPRLNSHHHHIHREEPTPMSQSGLTTEPHVAWPSDGISEVPFRLYTDAAQYQREQERLFKGPTWNYLCLAVELAHPGDYIATTIGETAVIVVRDAA